MKNATEIVYIVDRSGSMSGLADDVRGSFNAFVKEQQSGDDECRLTLIQFDTEYSVDYVSKDINEVQDIDYRIQGMTALFDAVGQGITQLGKRLAALDEEERPESVVFVIQTDGYENSSKEFTGKQIGEMIKHQREKYNWEFIFLGADFDAETFGKTLNIDNNNTVNLSKDNYTSAMNMTSQKIMNLRATRDAGSLSYTAEDKKSVMS